MGVEEVEDDGAVGEPECQKHDTGEVGDAEGLGTEAEAPHGSQEKKKCGGLEGDMGVGVDDAGEDGGENGGGEDGEEGEKLEGFFAVVRHGDGVRFYVREVCGTDKAKVSGEWRRVGGSDSSMSRWKWRGKCG